MDVEKTSFTYLRHLDGLRAISVFAVLIFHLKPGWLPGGFLGVDVFFVISGFIITSLLLHEISNYGRIDFSNFYFRRFKRLFPSFLLVVLTSTISAYIWFDQSRFVLVVKTALFSLLGLSNVYFYKTSDYFDISSIEKPLLHLWSLNLEEQFYLIWPILVFLFHDSFRKKPRYFLALISSSFIISVYININYPTAAFYLPFFRIYEFLTGAGIALLQKNKGNYGIRNLILFFASIIALPMSFLIFDETTLLPGPKSLLLIIPIICLINIGNIASKYNPLRHPILTYFGKRSYTIYLVHWPIIVFYLESQSKSDLSSYEALLLALATLISASFLYRFYEYPMRISSKNSKVFIAVLVSFLIILVSISIPTLINNKKPFSSEKSLLFTPSEIESGKLLRFKARVEVCEKKGWDICDIPIQNKFKVLVMGDSHAVDALTAMNLHFPSFDYSMSQLGGCPPTLRLNDLVPRTFPNYRECLDLNGARQKVSYLKSFDVIVIDVMFGWYKPEDLIEYLSYLRQNGIRKVLVVGDYLELSSDLPQLINSRGFDCRQISQFIKKKNESYYFKLAKFMNQNNYYFIDPNEVFSKQDECSLWDQNRIPFTWDNQHLSNEFQMKLLENDISKLKIYFQAK